MSERELFNGLLCLLGIFGLWLIIAPVVALLRANAALAAARETRRENDRLHHRLREIQLRLEALGETHAPAAPPPGYESPRPPAAPEPPASLTPPLADTPPELPLVAAEKHAAAEKSAPDESTPAPGGDTPPPLPASAEAPSPTRPAPAPAQPAAFNAEQFIGAKLFAWAGGLALFLCAAFAIKYSFEHDLVPPAFRAAFGFATGLALIIGGLRLNRAKFAVTQQSLAATGTLILYAVTFACSAQNLWRLIPPHVAFGLMSLVTGAAFLLAVRLQARVVAVLGIAGGFLTPALLSTGEDNPAGLFGYIALLDAGLLAVALRQRWHFLSGLGALGTIAMALGWAGEFYSDGRYGYSEKIYLPMAILLGLQALFTGAAYLAKRRDQTNAWTSRSALAIGGTAMLALIAFLDSTFLSYTPAIPFAYAFLVEALVFALAACDKRIRFAGPLAGGFVFLMLGLWTQVRLAEVNLGTALALYLAFALLHTVVPLVLKRLGKIAETPAWCHAFPILSLILTLVAAFDYDSMLVWPILLLIDITAVVLALAGGLLWPLLIVLALTAAAAVGTLLHVGPNLSGLNVWLVILGVVSTAFMALGARIRKQFPPAASDGTGNPVAPGNAAIATILPAIPAILPFLLLTMATMRLPLADPSSVFGMALLLSIVILGLAKTLRMGALAPVGLAGVALLEFAWSNNHPPAPAYNAGLALAWHLGFAALHFAHPFVFHKTYAGKVAPWIASVASLGVHFLLIHDTVIAAWPHGYPGLHALAFAAPAFAGLHLVLKRTPAESPARLSQIALFAGAALAFITLIFPLQFERQWLTLAWALEGAALLGLFRSVPHNGLRLAAFALLAAAFARLALNPAVLAYHPRGEIPVLNGHLYTYGLAIAALSVSARLLRPPANLFGGRDMAGLLRAGSAVLGFLLLNIEIADFFSEPGRAVLTFDFADNLPRDMAYSIGWGLYALGMLVTGMLRRNRVARYAAIGLLVATFGKLFLNDLANLDQLHRIGAFFGVSVIGFTASLLYQKFLSGERK